MKRRIRWVLIAAAVLALIAACGAWLLTPREGLMDHATLLTTTKEWDSASLPRLENFWLNDQEVFYPHRETDGSLSLYRKTVLPPGNQQAAKSMHLSLPASSYPLFLSPDRQYLSYLIPNRTAKGRFGSMPVSMFLSFKDGKHTKWTGSLIKGSSLTFITW